MSTPCAIDASHQSQCSKVQHRVESRRRSLRQLESLDRVARYLDRPDLRPSEAGPALTDVVATAESRLAVRDDDEVSPEDEVESGTGVTSPELESKVLLVVEKPEESATKRRSSLRKRREDPAETVVKEQTVRHFDRHFRDRSVSQLMCIPLLFSIFQNFYSVLPNRTST